MHSPKCSTAVRLRAGRCRFGSPSTPLFADVDAAVAAPLGTRYSAAVVRIEQRGRVVHERAFGTLRGDVPAPACTVDTRFDLASITKVFVATAALDAVARGRLALDVPLVDVVPEWRGTDHAPITLRMILAHDGGFKSGADWRTLLDRNVEQFALSEALVAAPGERVVYSDLGFLALGVIIARSAQCGLATAVEHALAHCGAAATTYRPRDRAAIPATERDTWRGLVQGTVHDEKAALAGGAAGHAGLFGDAREVAALAEWYLGAVHGRPTPLDVALAQAAVREQADDPILRRGLGWALKTSDDNSCGARMSPETFGHTGFTGTCVWADPVRDCSVTLLTNAVHYGRSDTRLIRSAVCDAAMNALDRAC